MEILVKSTSELAQAAITFCNSIQSNKVFLFYGQMGAGKTTFIKEICKNIGVIQEVNSPTFAIVNEYSGEKYQNIYHFDFYRIDKLSEIYDIGFEEYVDSGDLLLIEWPEKLDYLVPENAVEVTIEIVDKNSRLIKW